MLWGAKVCEQLSIININWKVDTANKSKWFWWKHKQSAATAVTRSKQHPFSWSFRRIFTWCYSGNWLPGSYNYAAPAWWGFVSLAERDRIQSVIKKAQRYGYLPRNFPDFSSLVDALETNLFNSILYNPNHVLHQLMPAEKINSHNLRERFHNFTIPLIVNNMLRKNFLYRLLFRDMY